MINIETREYNRQWYLKNKEKYKERYKKHKKKLDEYLRQWRKNNKEKTKEYDKQYCLRNPEKVKERHKKYRRENKEKRNQYTREYYLKNKKEVNKKSGQYKKERRKTDLKFRLNANMASTISSEMGSRKQGRKWQDLVGYSLKDLIKHLEAQFDDKINWNNYGYYWHIDHIKPKSLFNFTSEKDQEFRKCWGLENLQPLEKIANLKKSNHWRT